MVKIKFNRADVAVNYTGLNDRLPLLDHVSWKANVTPSKKEALHSKIGAAAEPAQQKEEHNRLETQLTEQYGDASQNPTAKAHT